MNTLYNQRFVSTEEKIQKALFSLLKFKKYNDISIKEICYEAGINRSSFYAHYFGINDLMSKTESKLSEKISEIFSPSKIWDENVFVKLFEFLLENKVFYKSYLETNEQAFMEKNDFINYINVTALSEKAKRFSKTEKLYHMAFFAGGLKALSKSWILGGCKESPQEMAKILTNEYVL